MGCDPERVARSGRAAVLELLDKLPKRRQAQGKIMLKEMMYAPSKKEAVRLRGVFQAWCRKHGLEDAARLIEKDWERMVTFYQYPKEHWILFEQRIRSSRRFRG